MTAIIVKPRHFSGNRKVFDNSSSGLGAIIRGLAIDNARLKLEASGVTDFIDSSTGTAAASPYPLVDVPIAPSGVFNAVSGGGVGYSALNTAIGVVNNVHAVLGTQFNIALAKIGLTAVAGLGTGTVATAGTIPAMTKTATTASGTSAVNYASYVAIMTILKSNHRKLVLVHQQLATALGVIVAPTSTLLGQFTQDETLYAPGSTVADSTGASSVLLADGTAALTALASNVATIAAAWNAEMTQSDTYALSVVAG